jgi:hypothetical protein
MNRTAGRKSSSHRVHRLHLGILCLLPVLVLGVSACELTLGPDTGTLEVRIGALQEIGDPDFKPDMEIVSYQAVLTGSAGGRAEQTGSEPLMLFENLPSGLWQLEVEAFNAFGQLIGRSSSAESGRNGEVQNELPAVTVVKAAVRSVNVGLVPADSGTGSFALTLDWGGLAVDYARSKPLLNVTLLSYADGTRFEREYSPESGTQHTVLFEELPAGYYTAEVRFLLSQQQEGNSRGIEDDYWSGSYLLYLNPGDEVLRGTALLSEGAEHTGDMVITVISRTEDSAVEVTYDCVPVLEQGIAQVRFEAAAHGFWSDPLYRWTVNGEPSPVTGDELDWDFSQQGRYRVNLTVIDRIGSVDAALGSWSKDIVVFDELPEVGERGPAGGWIIVDKGEVSEGWRFLEAAPEDLSAYGTWSFAYSSDTGPSAEELANRYSRDGFDDWFLPAAEHLELMHAVLYTQGLGGFAGESLYWSSSQADSPGSAQAYRFTDASVVTAGMYRLSRIRPVRGF